MIWTIEESVTDGGGLQRHMNPFPKQPRLNVHKRNTTSRHIAVGIEQAANDEQLSCSSHQAPVVRLGQSSDHDNNPQFGRGDPSSLTSALATDTAKLNKDLNLSKPTTGKL
jgi:hypothetical protein